MDMDLQVTLLPAEDDSYYLEPQYQHELRRFAEGFREQGVPIDAKRALIKIAGAEVLSGEFALKLAATVGPVLGTVAGAWLHARYGRKVRLKIGNVEAEAQTVAEVEKLLEQAEKFQLRNEPKVIHEP
jgi:hypothetical protein